MVRDDVAKELEKIKQKQGISYSEVIKKLLPRDYELDQINEYFGGLKKILPEDVKIVLELMRVIVVRLYKLPRKQQEEQQKYLKEELQKLLTYIVGGEE